MSSILPIRSTTMEPTSMVPAKVSRATRVTTSERKPEREARTSQLLKSVLGMPISAGVLPDKPYRVLPSALASNITLFREPNCMLKDPSGEVYICWRTLLLQRRSTRTSCGSFVPSLVATRPRRNMTRSPVGRMGCKEGEAGFVGCPGFEEGEDGGGAGPGFGEGVGLGGFCAQTIGVKRRNRRASSTRMRVRGLMSCLLRVSDARSSAGMSLGSGKVQVN